MNTRLMRELAKAKGLSHQRIANELGVDQSAVTRWFTGENWPHARHIAPLADLLGVPADMILRNKPASVSLEHAGAA